MNRSIVVGVDGSAPSLAAVGYGVALASRCGGLGRGRVARPRTVVVSAGPGWSATPVTTSAFRSRCRP